MVNLLETDVFIKNADDLIEHGIIDTNFRLTERYWEEFYKYKGLYVLETMMYPMFVLFNTVDLGEKEYDYFHIILNLFVNERPEFLESINLEKKFAERRMIDEERKS